MANPIIVNAPTVEHEYDVTKETTTEPKTVTTSYTAPSPEVQQQLDANAEQYRKALGGTPDGSFTPFGGLIDTDKEKLRLQREAELAEFKKKESGWYNGIALALDALTAGIGGNVYPRNVNKAQEANQRQEYIMAQQRAADHAASEDVKSRANAYAKYLNDLSGRYLTKTTTTNGGNTTETTRHGEKKTDKGVVVTPSQLNPGRDWQAYDAAEGKGKPSFVVKMNSNDPSKAQYQHFELKDQDEYNRIRDILKAYYKKKVTDERNSDSNASGGYFDKLRRIGAMGDDGEWKDPNLLMRSGEFYDLDDAVKKQIVTATGGRVKFDEQTITAPYILTGAAQQGQQGLVAPYMVTK